MLRRIAVVIGVLLMVRAEINNFDYSQNGKDWEKQAPKGTDWSQCSSQQQQSPIEISPNAALSNDSYLFANFYPQKGLIYWYNTTVYIRSAVISNSFGEVYTKLINGAIPSLRATEVRIRSHAQHKFQGRDYHDLQLQIFCVDLYASFRNIKLAFSFMFKVGPDEDPALKVIQDNFIQGNETVPFPSINATMSFSHLLNNEEPFDFYYYQGSLTIPPCFKGGVNWIISKKEYSMSQKQRDFFYKLFNGEGKKGNWRELQPLNDNPLNFYQFGK